jgi:hypothetical protein
LATFTNIHPSAAFACGAHIDALFQGTKISLPPAIILDYMYGVAAYKRWRSSQIDDEVHNIMKSYHREHYAGIPVPPYNNNGNDSFSKKRYSFSNPVLISDNGSSKKQDHVYGPDDPPITLPQLSTRRGDTMEKAMDELNLGLMCLQGITPQEAADRQEKQMEEEEQKAHEASHSKVTEWIKTSMDTSD